MAGNDQFQGIWLSFGEGIMAGSGNECCVERELSAGTVLFCSFVPVVAENNYYPLPLTMKEKRNVA